LKELAKFPKTGRTTESSKLQRSLLGALLDKQDHGDEEDNSSICPLVPNLSPVSTDEYKLGKRR
jgi:hypothetical protein